MNIVLNYILSTIPQVSLNDNSRWKLIHDEMIEQQQTTKKSIQLREWLVSFAMVYTTAAAAAVAIERITLTALFWIPSLPYHVDCITLTVLITVAIITKRLCHSLF